MKDSKKPNVNLRFEEMEEVQEFSLGGLGLGAMVVAIIAIITKFLMQLI